MSTELDIFKIDFDEKFRSHGHVITLTQIGNGVYDTDFIEAIQETSRQKYWHLEGECGFTGEILGTDIKALVSYTNYANREPKNAELILENLEMETFYRFNISF